MRELKPVDVCSQVFFLSLRQQDFRVRRCWETSLKFRLERMVWQKDSRGVSSRPMPFSERGSRRKRVWCQTRMPLGADSVASGCRFGRVWDDVRWQIRILYCPSALDVGNLLFPGCAKYRICFSALPILKVNSISIKHRRWGMTLSLLCSWDDRMKKRLPVHAWIGSLFVFI